MKDWRDVVLGMVFIWLTLITAVGFYIAITKPNCGGGEIAIHISFNGWSCIPGYKVQ